MALILDAVVDLSRLELALTLLFHRSVFVTLAASAVCLSTAISESVGTATL